MSRYTISFPGKWDGSGEINEHVYHDVDRVLDDFNYWHNQGGIKNCLVKVTIHEHNIEVEIPGTATGDEALLLIEEAIMPKDDGRP